MQRATRIFSEVEEMNALEDDNQLVIWSVTVPKKKSIITQSALGEKQVCLTLDTMANSFQIAEWPSDGEAAARAKNLGLRRESVSIDSSDDKADVHFAKSRVSLATSEWDSIFGTQKIKQHSRWPMKFVFEDVGMFIRGSDGRSLTLASERTYSVYGVSCRPVAMAWLALT